MTAWQFSSLLLCSAMLLVAADDHIVLPPSLPEGAPATAAGEKMLVFMPGGKVPNQHYEATARAIQAAAAEQQLRLWVVIPAVFQRLCVITCPYKGLCQPLGQSVNGALSKASKLGWRRGKDSEDLWLAGHSLGGVCANTLFQAKESRGALPPFAGLVVMGSYVDESGEHDLPHFPVPLLTLNVELDGGLARPGKTSVWWHQHLALRATKGKQLATTEKPVVVLPKLNHSDFCPGFDVPGDLPAEVDQATATRTIGDSVAAFLLLHTSSSSVAARSWALNLLQRQVQWTEDFLAPYLRAQAMERTESDTSISAEGSSSLCAQAQRIVAGLTEADDHRLEVQDGFHVSSPNLEHCHPNWTTLADSRLLIRTCSHTDYYPDIANTGSITAASELACKLLSFDRVAQQLPAASAHRVACSEVNRHSVKLAESMAAPSTLARFRRQGRGWCFLDDVATLGNIGPVWVFKDGLQLKENATCMSVASPVLFSGLESKIYPGNQYCKVLSPARVLDWMMTDSLKQAKAGKVGVMEAEPADVVKAVELLV